MQYFFLTLSALCGLYSVIIFVRIIMSWFPETSFGRFYVYLRRITDPYLLLFVRVPRPSFLPFDFTPLLAIIALNLGSTIFARLALTGRISIGLLLSLAISMIGQAVTFIVGFYIIIMILRLIAYYINADIHAPFWQIIDYISRPVSYHTGRLFFRNRTGSYVSGIIISIVTLIMGNILLSAFFSFVEQIFAKLPF